MQTIKIAIAEDHLKYRETLKSLLNTEKNLEIIFEADNGEELLQKLKSNEVDIVLLDFQMPIMNGLEALKEIRIKYPNVKTIINSSIDEEMIVAEFKKSGANSYILKSTDYPILLETINIVQEKGFCYNDMFIKQ